ncbi:MAG: hypothetical protein IJX63_02070 [Lachnospiraceae bacterium]|nr:hypothetical protein [Lachnospiraceae bacterium]
MDRTCGAVHSCGKRIGSVLVVCLVTGMLFLYNWNVEAVLETHTMPQNQQQNIYAWVRQHVLPRAQVQVIAAQTGVNEKVVKELLEAGKWQQLLELQGAYFAPVYTESLPSSIVTVSEYVVNKDGQYVDGTHLADVREGDILITKNSRFLGWRNGHAGLVVDAEEGLVLEAIMLGMDTRLCKIEKWLGYPSFQVLRAKAELEVPVKQVVAYASKHLVGVPYQLLAGVRGRVFGKGAVTVSEKEETEVAVVKGTQCAHLVWQAYMQVGIDLDSDSGLLVTPADIQNSPYLEVIQSYGY